MNYFGSGTLFCAQTKCTGKNSIAHSIDQNENRGFSTANLALVKLLLTSVEVMSEKKVKDQALSQMSLIITFRFSESKCKATLPTACADSEDMFALENVVFIQ